MRSYEEINTHKLKGIGIDRIAVDFKNILSINTKHRNFNFMSITITNEDDLDSIKVFDTATNKHVHIREIDITFDTDNEQTSFISDDDNINYCLYQLKPNSRAAKAFGANTVLDICISRVANKTIHNIYNLKASNKRVKEILNSIRDNIYNETGIVIEDIESWDVLKLEINRTIKTEQPLFSYRYSLESLMDQLYNKELMNQSAMTKSKHKSEESNSYYLQLSYMRSIDTVIYDKSAQLLTKLDLEVDKNLMRVEIKLKKKAIKAYFTNDLNINNVLCNKDRISAIYNKAINTLMRNIKDMYNDDITMLETKIQKGNYKELRKFIEDDAIYYEDNLARIKNSDTFTILQAFKNYHIKNNSIEKFNDILKRIRMIHRNKTGSIGLNKASLVKLIELEKLLNLIATDKDKIRIVDTQIKKLATDILKK